VAALWIEYRVRRICPEIRGKSGFRFDISGLTSRACRAYRQPDVRVLASPLAQLTNVAQRVRLRAVSAGHCDPSNSGTHHGAAGRA
jgi:hypothetical protein